EIPEKRKPNCGIACLRCACGHVIGEYISLLLIDGGGHSSLGTMSGQEYLSYVRKVAKGDPGSKPVDSFSLPVSKFLS
ncbi:hypothetical protein ACQP3D_27250, partial [Escherichia coli]